MSESSSWELQVAVRQRLIAHTPLVALIGERVYDNVPAKPQFPYVSFGASDIIPADSHLIPARDESLQIDIWSRLSGQRHEAKKITDMVLSLLRDWTADIGENALVSTMVTLARVVRELDGITAHGLVQITARIEEK